MLRLLLADGGRGFARLGFTCVLFCWKFLEEGVSGALFLIPEVEGARLVRLGGIDGETSGAFSAVNSGSLRAP